VPYIQSGRSILYSLHRSACSRGLQAGRERGLQAEALEVETEAGQSSIPPPVQGPPPLQESAREVEVHLISSDDTSRAKEVADAEAAGTMEQSAPTSGEGRSALV
jgi:hypothetical protein